MNRKEAEVIIKPIVDEWLAAKKHYKEWQDKIDKIVEETYRKALNLVFEEQVKNITPKMLKKDNLDE